MNKLILYTAIALTIGCTFSGCKKDENDSPDEVAALLVGSQWHVDKLAASFDGTTWKEMAPDPMEFGTFISTFLFYENGTVKIVGDNEVIVSWRLLHEKHQGKPVLVLEDDGEQVTYRIDELTKSSLVLYQLDGGITVAIQDSNGEYSETKMLKLYFTR